MKKNVQVTGAEIRKSNTDQYVGSFALVSDEAKIIDAMLMLAMKDPDVFFRQCERSINIVINTVILTSQDIIAKMMKIGNVVTLNMAKS